MLSSSDQSGEQRRFCSGPYEDRYLEAEALRLEAETGWNGKKSVLTNEEVS